MKKIILLLCALAVISCDSDDSSNGGSNGTANLNYFPSTLNDSWDYEVSTGTDSSTETLTVDSVTGNEFTLVANPTTPVGFMTRILSGGTLQKESGKLIGNGMIDLGLQGINGLNIVINNGALYDQNATPGTQLFMTDGVTTQTVQTYDLDISYDVITVQQASVAQMTVEGSTYNDVIHSQLIVNATITTDITLAGFTQQIALMQPQDVLVIDNYWSQNIGLIKSDSQIDYMLEDFSSIGVTLPVPQSASVLTIQNLTSHNIQ